jgi:hypothetical protein
MAATKVTATPMKPSAAAVKSSTPSEPAGENRYCKYLQRDEHPYGYCNRQSPHTITPRDSLSVPIIAMPITPYAVVFYEFLGAKPAGTKSRTILVFVLLTASRSS